MTTAPPAPGTDDIDEAAAQRSRRKLIAGFVGFYVLAGLAGFVVAAHSGHRHTGHHRSALGMVVVLAILAVVLAATLLVTLRIYRRPTYRRLMQYGWRRRWRVGQALRRGTPVATDDLPVASAIADMQRALWWLPVLYVVLPILWTINSISHHGFARWYYLALSVWFLAMIPLVIRQRRRIIRNYDRLKDQPA
jgi:hypothetical protein